MTIIGAALEILATTRRGSQLFDGSAWMTALLCSLGKDKIFSDWLH